jgi:hypothetical protein
MHNTFTRIRTCALAAAAILFFGSEALAQGGPAVTVVNTPLPVTVTNPTTPPSTVNIGNAPALAAAITQALLGTPLAVTLSPGTAGAISFPVPAGQRLVIEYVSGICSTFPSIPVGLAVVTNGAANVHLISTTVLPGLPAQSQQGRAAFGDVVKIYADPGTKGMSRPLLN